MQVCKLEEIADVFTGATVRRYVNKNAKIKKVIVERSLHRGKEIKDFEEMKISDKLNDKYFTQIGDVLIKTKFPNDAVYVKEKGLIVGERIIIIRFNDLEISNFVAHELNSQYIKEQISKELSSGSTPLISVKSIRKLKIKLPESKIQKEYTQLLNKLDESISLYENQKNDDKMARDGFLNNLLGGN